MRVGHNTEELWDIDEKKEKKNKGKEMRRPDQVE